MARTDFLQPCERCEQGCQPRIAALENELRRIGRFPCQSPRGRWKNKDCGSCLTCGARAVLGERSNTASDNGRTASMGDGTSADVTNACDAPDCEFEAGHEAEHPHGKR